MLTMAQEAHKMPGQRVADAALGLTCGCLCAECEWRLRVQAGKLEQLIRTSSGEHRTRMKLRRRSDAIQDRQKRGSVRQLWRRPSNMSTGSAKMSGSKKSQAMRRSQVAASFLFVAAILLGQRAAAEAGNKFHWATDERTARGQQQVQSKAKTEAERSLVETDGAQERVSMRSLSDNSPESTPNSTRFQEFLETSPAGAINHALGQPASERQLSPDVARSIGQRDAQQDNATRAEQVRWPHRGRRRRRWMFAVGQPKKAQERARRPTSGRPLISASLRGQVELKCNLQPPDADDEVSLILWYKDNSMVPIYSVDARAAPVLEARHKPGAWLEGRANLRIVEQSAEWQLEQQMEERQVGNRPREQLNRRRKRRESSREGAEEEPSEMETTSVAERLEPSRAARAAKAQLVARLRIDSLSSEDNGLYKCRVDFRRSRSRIEEAELRIIVPAERPTIRDLTPGSRSRPSGAAASLVGPHNEGSRVVLECETSGGYPEPSLSWWRNGKLVDDSYELVSASGGLVLERRRGVAKSPAELEEATSGVAAGEEPADELSPFESGGQSDESLAAGESSRAASSETGATSPASVSPPPTSSSPPNTLIRNRLELAAVTRDDLLANYSCAARNNKLGPVPTSYVMIDMNLRPLRVQLENERAPVLAGKPLEVLCRAWGSRPASLISWHLGDTKLTPAGEQSAPESAGRAGDQRRAGSPDKVSISESISADSNVTSSTLTFVPRLEHSGQLLVCRAENSFIASGGAESGLNELAAESRPFANSAPANTLDDSWRLEVHYLPRVKLNLGDKLQGRPIQVGHDVYFECSALAQPPVRELRWWFNGKELDTNGSSGVIISNQSLVLQRVSRQQRGHYTCSAVNAVGEAQSNSVHLRVQHAPYCYDSKPASGASRQQLAASEDTNLPETEQDSGPGKHQAVGAVWRHKTHYGAARLESVRVHCRVRADPSEALTFKWAFVAKSAEQSADKSVPGSGGTSVAAKPGWSGQQLVYLDSSWAERPAGGELESVLNYTPKSELDYGTLLCWATNALGQQAEPCVYQLVPAERPEPVRKCRLLNASHAQLAVACEPGYDGGIDQSFHMEVYDSVRRELVANVTNIPGLSSEIFSEQARKSHELSGANEDQEPHSNQLNDQEASVEANDQQTPASSGPSTLSKSNSDASRQLAASLVSETLSGESQNQSQSRQPKQRHSHQNQSQLKSSAGKRLKTLESSQEGEREPHEAIFLTEPQLAPGTDYLLTIYSSNSKGSSRPLSLTASTSNMTAPLNSVASSIWPLFGASHTRRPGESALMNEMLALSWSPFMLVCAVTVLIFLLFASVTFALMKYVDLAGVLLPSGQTSKRADSGEGAHRKSPGAVQQANGQTLAPHEGESSSESYTMQERREEASSPGVKRARVIAIGNWPAQSSRLSAERELEIPLNGMLASRADCSSLLSGSFLRSKLQQLTTGAGQQSLSVPVAGRIKQSNSDNFLNQAAAPLAGQSSFPSQAATNQAAASGQALALAAHDANWALGWRPAHQAAYYAGGTLPRHHPTALLESGAAGSNAYGYLKVINPSGQAARLMPAGHLELLASGGSAAASPSCQASAYQQQRELAAPIEHLLISGKQYIHQARPQTHLRMTSAAALEQQQQQEQLDYMGGASDGQRAPQAAVPQFSDAIQYCASASGANEASRQLTNAPTKTSDLGDEEEEQQSQAARHTFAHLQQQAHGQLNFADSDGMSSQGTQRSLNTAGMQANSASTTNGSPSSGLGQELANCSHCQLEGDTLPGHYAALAAYQQHAPSSSASSTLASACEQQQEGCFDLNYSQLDQQDVELLPVSVELSEQHHQDQLLPYGTLKPAPKTVSTLRTNKKSATFDPKLIPIGNHIGLDLNNNNEFLENSANGGQFYMVQSAVDSDSMSRGRSSTAKMKPRVCLVNNERPNQTSGDKTQIKSGSSRLMVLDPNVSMPFLGLNCEGCQENDSDQLAAKQLQTDV